MVFSGAPLSPARRAGEDTGAPLRFPQLAFFRRNSLCRSSRRRLHPRSARRIFCIRETATSAMISFASMSQERLEASLDIDRRSSLEIVRIIQEQDARVAAAVAAEAEKIA